MEAVCGAIDFALLSRSEALVARARTSISMVTGAGVGVSSVMNRGEDVAASALHSDVLQKKEGGAAPKISPNGMQIMCCSTVAKAGAVSG
jgi:hypothetical protein